MTIRTLNTQGTKKVMKHEEKNNYWTVHYLFWYITVNKMAYNSPLWTVIYYTIVTYITNLL